MASILELIARITLNKNGFDAGLASATRDVEKFGRELTKKVGQAFGITAILAFAREVSETGKEIDKLADKLNLTTQAAQNIRLGEKLGGDDTRGIVGMSDKDLERLRVADRLQIKLRENSKSFLFKAFRSGWLGGTLGDIGDVFESSMRVAAGKNLVSSAVPNLEQKAREKAIREQVLKTEQEIKEIRQKTAFDSLNEEEQLNDLIRRRLILFEQISHEGVLSLSGKALLEKQGAELDQQIEQIERRQRNQKPDINIPGLPERSGLPGVFIGEHGSATSPFRETNQHLKDIKADLFQRGILVRDTR